MTNTTAITPSDQDPKHRWPTALVPNQLDTAVVTDTTVPTGNPT